MAIESMRLSIVQKLILLVQLALSVSSQTTGDIRLTGYGSNHFGGVLEVYLNNVWGTVCGSNTNSLVTATVVCRQLGLGPAVDVVYYPDLRYGISDQEVAIGNVICTGVESHLLRCNYHLKPDCYPYQNIGVMCSEQPLPYSGSIRITSNLPPSTSLSNGHLQLYLSGEWLDVCSNKFTISSANSACRQMGYTTADKFTSSSIVGINTWDFNPTNCTNDSPCLSTCANETAMKTTECTQGRVLLYCLFDPIMANTSSSGNQSTCEVNHPFLSDIRMTSLSDDGVQGVPEVTNTVMVEPGVHDKKPQGLLLQLIYVYVADGWLKICLEPFSLPVADVVCKQLGHPAALKYEAAMGQASGISFNCSGIESSSQDCQMTIINDCSLFVNLRCNNGVPPYGSLRLFGGSGVAGSLHLFNGSLYVPLCDDKFGPNELMVACRQLGYENGIQVVNNTLYGLSAYTTAPYLKTFSCTGSEDHILNCKGLVPSSSLFCRDPYDSVSIQCGGPIGVRTRLVNGNVTSGQLQIELNDEWGTVCGRDFSHYDAHVACREMGFETTTGFMMIEDSSSNEAVPIHITSFQCSGFESNLVSCPHQVADNGTCQHSDDVYLYCSYEYPVQDGTTRLIGNSPNSGRMEIMYHGIWMSVCGKLFNKNAPDVVCRQMGYTHAEAYCTNSCNGSGTGDIFFGETDCLGNELSLIECETDIHNRDLCDHQHDVWITCSKDRLAVSSSSSILSTSSTSSFRIATEPTSDSDTPKQSLLPFDILYLYIVMGVVLLVIILVILAAVCCVCIYKKRKQNRRFRDNNLERRPEPHVGTDEPDFATSPHATNASFLRISPPQSRDDISMTDLKVCPQKELELGSLYGGGIQSDVPIEWRGLNIAGAVGGATSREQSGVFEEVDFGLPPRYEELSFEDSSEYDQSILACAHDSRQQSDKRSSHVDSNGVGEKELKFTTIRIPGEL